MKHIFVRPVTEKDIPTIKAYQNGTPNNLYDADVFSYPTSFALAAYNKTGPIVYVPIQQPFFMEALGIRPGLDAVDTAVALKELTQALVTLAHTKGVGEIYMLCKEESTIAFAERQCFERMPWPAFRIKLKNLEGQ
jgi:hypothetical protein